MALLIAYYHVEMTHGSVSSYIPLHHCQLCLYVLHMCTFYTHCICAHFMCVGIGPHTLFTINENLFYILWNMGQILSMVQ